MLLSVFNLKCFVLCATFCCLTRGYQINFNNVTLQLYIPTTWYPGISIEPYQEITVQNAINLTDYYNETDTREGFGILINNSHIPILHTNSIKDLKNLGAISLNRNNIQDIESVPFKNLPSLTEVNINDNQIKKITADVFSEVPSVENIFLINNQITHIDSDAFKNTVNLTMLFLSGNKLEVFDVKWFQNTPNLQYLDMSRNHLKHLPAQPFNLPKGAHEFSSLDFSDNEIETIDEDFMPKASTLGGINLTNNKLKVINADIFKYQRFIMSAIFDNNQITEIKGVIPGFIVSLKNNNIKCLPLIMRIMMKAGGTVLVDGNPEYKNESCH